MAASRETAFRAARRTFPERSVEVIETPSCSTRNGLFEIGFDGRWDPLILKICDRTRDRGRSWAEPRIQRFVNTKTPVPTPGLLAVDDSEQHIPYPFFAMERVGGHNCERRYKHLPAEERERLVRSIAGLLASLHGSVRFDNVGRLMQKESRLHARPVDGGWYDVFCRSFDEHCSNLRGTRFEDLLDELSSLDPGRELFEGVRRPTLVHRDVHLGNFLVEDGRVQSLLDWEDALAGDGEFDLVKMEINLTSRFRTSRIRRELRAAFYGQYLDRGPLSEGFAERSEYYRLCSLIEVLAAFDYWATPLGHRERERSAEHFRQQVTETIRRIRDGRTLSVVAAATDRKDAVARPATD